MRTPRKLKPGKDQIVCADWSQCDPFEPQLVVQFGGNRMPHLHDPCGCDPDVDDGNVRHHVKHTLEGHWPTVDDHDVVICPVCRGYLQRQRSHKAALNRQPLRGNQ